MSERFEPTAEPRPAYSRALLTPGPLPPLSHLGVTLLRHAAMTGLRYSLYHLGLPQPDAPPFRILRLRLYLEARELRPLLADVPGGEDVLAALIEPGGAGARPAEARALAAALGFHRLRLFRFRPPSARLLLPREDEQPDELWRRFRAHFTRLLGRVNDAFLADLIASLDRRAARATGEEVPPVLSRAAWDLRTGAEADLRLFGLPDLLAPAWSEVPERVREAREALAPHEVPRHDRHRGRFREAWRALLTQLAPLYRALARSAADRGVLDSSEDAFFLPFDLAGDLAAPQRPAWMEAAVRSNRLEHENLHRAGEPLDLMTERQEMALTEGNRPEWNWAPLLPLP